MTILDIDFTIDDKNKTVDIFITTTKKTTLKDLIDSLGGKENKDIFDYTIRRIVNRGILETEEEKED